MTPPALRVVVGLGNDEPAYRFTPHNIGFWAVELLAVRLQFNRREKKEYVLFRPPSDAGDLSLVQAHSLMNVCGPKIRKALEDLKAKGGEFLVVCDDFALPWGRLRFRRSGSSGGHNGLKSVIEALGTPDFPRLRVGVGPVPDGMDPKDFVLKKQSAGRLKDLADKAAEALQAALTDGLEAAMNRFNAAPSDPEAP